MIRYYKAIKDILHKSRENEVQKGQVYSIKDRIPVTLKSPEIFLLRGKGGGSYDY